MATLGISAGKGRRPAETADMARVVALRNLALSPDGELALYSRADLAESGDRKEPSLWLLDVSNGSSSALSTDLSKARSPAWSPDGSQVALLLKDSNDLAQIYLHSIHEHTTRALSNAPGGVNSFLWSPDSSHIAFLSTTEDEELAPPPGVKIHTRADFRSQGDAPVVSSIWVIETTQKTHQPEANQLVKMEGDVVLSFWSHNSSAVYYTTQDTCEPYYGNGKSSLRSVNIKSGEKELARPLKVPGKGIDLDSAPIFVPSPDGSRLAFTLGNPDAPEEFAQPKLYLMELESGKAEIVTDNYDREIGDVFHWLDNDRIAAINSDFGNANIVVVDTRSHDVTPLWTGDRVVSNFAYSEKKIYRITDGGNAEALTSVNRFLREELDLTKPEQISYKGPSGLRVHGYLYKPPAFDASHIYPLITLAHGGPYACWTSEYMADVQAITAAGYLVFLPNPRGSESYGQDYASALSVGWPGPEYDDIMTGIDYLVTRPYVNGKKLGVSGGSAGGTLTDWAITHTSRFGAAVSISDIADFNLYWFLGDQPSMTGPESEPWLDGQDRKHSPITYAKNITTPTLFLSGTEDARTPAAVGGEQLFMAMKQLRVPTAFVQFEGAGHGLSGSSDPRHAGLGTSYLIKWMNLHLVGKPAPEFGVNCPEVSS
ncbi:unnamed protein product [Clonostachys byssicola]|uniref:Dipeptidyl-peptidase V n=1 Tax=Clonostachys byssicola TaxID=160290 RepID=A0A9N9UGM5_9HYPO|nr:unnamed protein product [Clonostachys byssicola]